MIYYHVWVRSAQYHGKEALTYKSAVNIAIGSIVEIPLRNQKTLGIVIRATKRPTFAVKPIISVYDLPPIPEPTIALAKWLTTFYPSSLGITTIQFLPRLIHLRYLEEIKDNVVDSITPLSQPTITPQQRDVLAQVEQPNTYLLHGRTGSGKTRIYTELTQKTLQTGKSALILSPEIGLTSQLAISFRQLFGDKVIVLHSQLGQKEREKTWLTILKAISPIIVIGPRSALFSPIAKLGLIVVDEAHDQAYKQGQAPYYHALRVASELSHIHKATLILGSATPSVTDYFLAVTRKKTILELDKLAITKDLDRQVTIVDLKDRSQFTRTPHLSIPLIQAISKSLAAKEQTLLYLNRRGTARLVICQTCGWQAICPNCDLPLTYHGDSHRLRCHVCGFSQNPFTNCPSCGRTDIILRSFGTKAIVEEAGSIFPDARIARFDTDNTKNNRLENQYQNIIDGKVDILVGTQMLAKGLDLPRLSTLGIVMADSSLYFPDYTAQERTYQLLTQVLGRIGRGHINSQAIIQTYYPESPIIKAALGNDWKKFYNLEIKERQVYNYPPFCHLLKLICRRSSPKNAEKAAIDFKNSLSKANLDITIEGPTPAFHEKIANKYCWQLVIKASNRHDLIKIVGLLPKNGWSYDIDPIDLL